MLRSKHDGTLYAIKIRKFIGAIGLLLFFSPLWSYAASNGVPANDLLRFAGYLGTPNQSEVPTACQSKSIYFSCGGYLVDVASIELSNDLARRIFVTAAHCVNSRDNENPFVVHFNNGDARVTESASCPRVIGFKEDSEFSYYKGLRSWALFTTKSSGVGVGSGKVDYAIILLNKPVEPKDVPYPAKVAVTNPGNMLTVSNIPILGMAGFGIAGLGNLDQKNSLGQPLLINGPRQKMYVEMPTTSVQNWNILSQMIVAQSEQTACNGDSGSALFLPTPDGSLTYTVYGHVANGDFNCRATNTSTRVDTQEFRDFVKSVKDEIMEEAAKIR